MTEESHQYIALNTDGSQSNHISLLNTEIHSKLDVNWKSQLGVKVKIDIPQMAKHAEERCFADTCM